MNELFADMLHATFELSQHPSLIPALLAIGLAGLVRGFAGFGGAMLFMPLASFLFEPRLAVVAFFFIDSIITLPLVWSAFKHWDARTVIPGALGAWVGVWFGAYLLASADELTLRWIISAIILALVLLMLSGWRYHDPPKAPLSVAVGGIAGVFGGIGQVAGPPMVAYWAAGPNSSMVIRANLISFFFFSSMGSAAAFFGNGIITEPAIGLALWLAPAYGLAIFLGAHLFKGASDRVFAYVALGIIVVAAVTSLPLLDPVLRPS